MVSSAPALHVQTPRQHALGVTFAIIVAIMWVLSSEMVQMVLKDPTADDRSFDKPYFVTYVSLSAFVLCLLGFVQPSWRAALHSPPAPKTLQDTYVPLTSNPPSPPIPAAPSAISPAPAALPDPEASLLDDPPVSVLNARQVFAVALVIAPLFFLADWTFTIGLGLTSVASSSTLSTLTALFTLLIGAYMRVERFSLVKLFAAFATIAGVAIISAYDARQQGPSTLGGDLINVLAAFIYALYTTVLKFKSGEPGTLDVAMLFTFIGVVVFFGAIPGFAVLHVAGWEKFQLPGKHVATVLFVNALVGTVLSDFLWAKSIVLTTPMIGTLALSLTVPLSVIVDFFFRGISFSFPYLVGVTMVFFGFIIVNVDELRESRRVAEAIGDQTGSDG